VTAITYRQIGIIRSPFTEARETPIQPSGATGINGFIELLPEYIRAMKDLEGFSHIILLYHFHLSKGYSPSVKPFLDSKYRGVLATRSPNRPNPIGLSVVRLDGIEGNILHIRDIDIVDGTPLLDIKPYVPAFDIREVERIGWLGNNIHKLWDTRDDGRFSKK
jgi:tRNA-Thr(GGU) m(6)t(6)A37 methyltransferase TsaA